MDSLAVRPRNQYQHNKYDGCSGRAVCIVLLGSRNCSRLLKSVSTVICSAKLHRLSLEPLAGFCYSWSEC